MVIPSQLIGWGTQALEIAIGIIFVVHGWGKFRSPNGAGQLLGGGKKAGLLFGLVEVASGIMIATGFGTFYGAATIIIVMLGAIYFKTTKWKVPFKTDGTGWEFDLLILAAALTLLIG